MIVSIFDALDALSKIEHGMISVVKTYYGKAYMPPDHPEGVIGYKLNYWFKNAFNMDDSIAQYLIHRKSFWNGWSEQCGLVTKPKTALGVTINREIYDDMLSNASDGIFNITNNNQIHRFRIKEIVDFVKHMNTFATNQNHGFAEVGFPIVLHYDVVTDMRTK